MAKIKTIVLFVALLMAASAELFGQGAPKPIIGAKGGLNLANIGGETGSKTKFAPHVGAYSEVFFDYFLMLQAEMLLSFQGHAPADDFDGKLNLTYLNIPVMARYNLGYNLNVHAGVQFGFLLSAKRVYQDVESNVKDQFKGMELALPIGVGYDLMDRKINATVRYVIGMSNILDSSTETRHNNVFQVSVGVLLLRLNE